MTVVALFADLLVATRVLIGVAFVLSAVVALTHWAVRTSKLQPFGGWATFVRKWSDPLLLPIEHRLRQAGGNPQQAPYWLMGTAVVGGLVLLSVLRWLFGTILPFIYAAESGPRGLAMASINLVFTILMMALLIRVFSSWFGLTRYTRGIALTYRLTDWIVEPIRRVMPTLGIFDFSPIVAWLALSLLRNLILGAM